jgi:uncharacterized membrane protein YebE (DUF533 family)
MKISTLIASIALALTANAFAQAPTDPAATPGIDQRQANQQSRINQGAASGQLTPREQAHMQTRQNHIASDKAAAKSDGVVTKQERAHIRHEQNRASKRIHKQKHDRQHTMPAAKG